MSSHDDVGSSLRDLVSRDLDLLTMVTFCVVLFRVICVFCLLVVLVRLSLPVQVIDWKDSHCACIFSTVNCEI